MPTGRARGRTLALRALKETAALRDRVRPPTPGIVVLLYHRVGGGGSTRIDMPAALFDEQMAWLAESGRAVSLDTAIEALSTTSAAPTAPTTSTERAGAAERLPIVVTFDDGTADLVDVALPILARHGVPATLYLATRHVDEQLPWPDDGVPLTWDGCRELVDSQLVTVGSHTHSHALLDRLPPAEAADELDRSTARIEDELGVAAEHFAYPKAVPPSAEVEAEVRRRFRSAALGGCRPNRPGTTDPHRLARTAIQVSDGMRWFRHKAAGGLAFEDTVRRGMNRIRYRGAKQ
jgi:peptidoglycan/xylan/chitin deacetylase (PgdA/CDA1 family)